MIAEKEKEQEEGEAPKSPTQIVVEGLSQISRTSTFLPKLGVTAASKIARSTSAAESRKHFQFESTLSAEREEAARKQAQLEAQIQAQQVALAENQNLLRQTQDQVQVMHAKFDETNTLLRAVLNLQRGPADGSAGGSTGGSA
jgi:hypothetical protein